MYDTISFPIKASPIDVVIPLKLANGDVLAISTVVVSDSSADVVFIFKVSGLTFLISNTKKFLKK